MFRRALVTTCLVAGKKLEKAVKAAPECAFLNT